MNTVKSQLIPVIGFLLLCLASFLYDIYKGDLTIWEFIGVTTISIGIYSILNVIHSTVVVRPYDLFSKKKSEYEEFLKKIEASVNKLIQKQRFIDQTTLDLIEKQANCIWVVTTNLATEINNKSLQESVMENLKNNKKYTYFLPHPESSYDEVDINLRIFKELDLYKKYKANIQFIRLPLETQFLLQEVVIYNPTDGENKDDNTKGLNAFTFYESKSEDMDSLHMKIEGDMLRHIRNRLSKYLESAGLKAAAQQILIEYGNFIDDKSYIANLIGKQEITDKMEYDNFILTLRNNPDSAPYVDDITEILSRYHAQ